MLKSLQLNTYKSLNHRKGPVITKFRPIKRLAVKFWKKKTEFAIGQDILKL